MRTLLVGTRSRLNTVIEDFIADQTDIELVAVLKEPALTEDMVFASVKSHDIDVAIFDLGSGNDIATDDHTIELGSLSAFIKDMLARFPRLVLVVLSSLGKEMRLHSEIHIDDVGLNQLLETIRAAVSAKDERDGSDTR